MARCQAYVPTQQEDIPTIAATLKVSGDVIPALIDPCAADGETLLQLAAAWGITPEKTYGIEVNYRRHMALAQRLLVPQATAPLGTPIQTTAGRWGRVPRVYIECTGDQAISIAAQRAMHSQLPCARVVTLDTSHSPFLSAPDAVAAHLLSV